MPAMKADDGLGLRLRAAREARGLSTFQLADRVGRTRTSVYRYEQGGQYPRLDALVALALALDVSLDYLVFGRGAGPATPEPAPG